MSKIKLIIADDHRLVREGIESLIKEMSGDLELLGKAKDGLHLLKLLDQSEPLPDIILMDVNMPEINGIECTAQVTEKYPSVKVIALSMMKQGVHIQEMLKAGAAGYLLKDCDKHELKEAIYTVYKGQPYFSNAVSDEVMKHLTKLGRTQEPLTTPLSPREKEILQLIAEDKSNQEIADKLYISIRTVETHKQNLLRKTGANSVAGLVIYAVKNNLVEV